MRITKSVLLAAAVTLASAEAHAAGLYFSDRGVRPMGRAGAFVAGADDLGAIWYNPAGLADAGTSALADFGWLHFTDSWNRQLRIVDADGTVKYPTFPKVSGASPVLPIPTLAASLALGKEKRWTLAGGFLAPEVALASYPDTLNGQPSPSRYTLGSYDGSALGVVGGWVAWKPVEQLRVGLGLLALVGVFQTTVTFSVCPPNRTVCAPEQPEWDAKSQIRVGPFVAPTVSAGVTWVPSKYVRVGISGQGPMMVSSHATLKVQLPSAVAVDGAQVNGQDAHVSFALPAIFRAGVEIRPIEPLRVEATFVREFWTVHHSIEAVPEGMSISGITAAPPINLPTISFPRNFDNANSYRLGGEYTVKAWTYPLDLRAGLAYEQSAVPASYVSLLGLDMNKVIVSIGGGIHVGEHWRLDAVWAHLFASTVTVSADSAAIPRVNPINGNATFEAVNGGTYSASADLIGVGVNYTF